MRRRDALVAAAGGIAIVLAGVTGCSAPRSAPGESQAPRAMPSDQAFGSPEEARDVAFVALQRYGELSDLIGAEGGVDPGRIFEVAEKGAWSAEEIAVFEAFERVGVRTEGASRLSKPRLVQYHDGASLIQLYTCLDVSDTQMIDSSGADVTPERDETIPYLATFTITPARSVLISRIEVWDRAGIC